MGYTSYFWLTQITRLLNGPMRVRPEFDPNPLSPNLNPLTSCRVRGLCQILPPLPIIDLLKEEFEEHLLNTKDWRTPIKTKLMSPEGVANLKKLKDYVLIAGDLYCRLLGGVLARCVSLQEAARKLTEVHEKSYEFSDGVSLYCRLQRSGYFWPNMSKEVASL
jgi:hypothetical protein